MSWITFRKLLLFVCVLVIAYAWINLCLNLWQNSIRFLMNKNGCRCGEVAK